MREPRINVYRCEYGCHTVTVDVGNGVTPFFIKCRAKSRPDRPLDKSLIGPDGECVGMAQSSFYPRGPMPPWIGEPTHEWYAPSAEEICRLSALSEVDHVMQGGLLLRPRTNALPILHSPATPPKVTPND